MYKSFLLIIIIIVPGFCFAELTLSELMYDSEGSDANSEWIEIYNNGTSAVDIASWHFYENETHHGLIPEGFSLLEPGARALIVQNIPAIRTLYGPDVQLIKSSFSLNNTGETLALSDPDKKIFSSLTYSSETGANGNGMSLQHSGGVWIQANPTPGKENASSDESQEGEGSNAPSQTSSKKKDPEKIVYKEDVDYYEGFVEFGEQHFRGSPVEMNVYVEHIKNNKKTILKNGEYHLNFGDGTSYSNNERFNLIHIYDHSGDYEVTFEFFRNERRLYPEEKPEVFMRKTLTIHDNSIEILSVSDMGDINLFNNTGADIDIGGWKVSSVDSEYVLPPHTYLKKDQILTLSVKSHGMKGIHTRSRIGIANNNGLPVSNYEYQKKNSKVVTNNKTREYSLVTVPKKKPSKVDEKQTQLETFLQQHPEKKEVSFGSYAEVFKNDTDDIESTNSFPVVIVVSLGLIALILSVVRFISLKKNSGATTQEQEVLGSIELIE